MRILATFDNYKDSITAEEACSIAAKLQWILAALNSRSRDHALAVTQTLKNLPPE